MEVCLGYHKYARGSFGQNDLDFCIVDNRPRDVGKEGNTDSVPIL